VVQGEEGTRGGTSGQEVDDHQGDEQACAIGMELDVAKGIEDGEHDSCPVVAGWVWMPVAGDAMDDDGAQTPVEGEGDVNAVLLEQGIVVAPIAQLHRDEFAEGAQDGTGQEDEPVGLSVPEQEGDQDHEGVEAPDQGWFFHQEEGGTPQSDDGDGQGVSDQGAAGGHFQDCAPGAGQTAEEGEEVGPDQGDPHGDAQDEVRGVVGPFAQVDFNDFRGCPQEGGGQHGGAVTGGGVVGGLDDEQQCQEQGGDDGMVPGQEYRCHEGTCHHRCRKQVVGETPDVADPLRLHATFSLSPLSNSDAFHCTGLAIGHQVPKKKYQGKRGVPWFTWESSVIACRVFIGFTVGAGVKFVVHFILNSFFA